MSLSTKLIRPAALFLMLACVVATCGVSDHAAQPPNGRGAAAQASSPQRAEWTVMVYADGDNNLEEAMLVDFGEISKVGSTDAVNVLVQLDRIGKYVTAEHDVFPYWTQTLRFRVARGQWPVPGSTPASYDIGEANMGDGRTLADFVAWSRANFPARRYALIISDHGQGWRGILAPTEAVRTLIYRSGADPLSQPRVDEMAVAFPFRTPIGSPFRTISFDETDKDKLYNREVQDALAQVLRGEKLDLIGFDACLMAMVETGYAMRGVASTFVGSQELEPGTGWQYDDWLRELTLNPGMDGRALGGLLVDSYRRRYGGSNEYGRPNPLTTLSATDLTRFEEFAAAISALSRSMTAKLNAEKANIKAARDACAVYAPDALGDNRDYFFHVDLARFCEQIIARTRDQEIKNRARAVRDMIKAAVLHNYAGDKRQDAFGSQGLAIYFPPGRAAYQNDWLHERGYENSRTRKRGGKAENAATEKPPVFPVEFVENHYWADFLHAYFERFE